VFGRALIAHGLASEARQAWQRALEEGAVPATYWHTQCALTLAADDKDAALPALPDEAEISSDPFVRGAYAAWMTVPRTRLSHLLGGCRKTAGTASYRHSSGPECCSDLPAWMKQSRCSGQALVTWPRLVDPGRV
jgi:hypothetical protein